MRTSPSPAFIALIADELARCPPSSVALAGMDWPPLPRPPGLAVCQVEALVRAPPSERRTDLAVLLHPDPGLDPQLCLQQGLAATLASLRDLHAARVMVAMPVADTAGAREAQREQLRALGFARIDLAEHPDPTGRHDPALLVHRFDLSDYKPTPAWLNPKNWAHPELWNRHRW